MRFIQVDQVEAQIYTDKYANALLIYCSDFRLVEGMYEFMYPQYKNEYDQIVLPGASAGVINYPIWKSASLEQINILKSLHHFNNIYIADHEDCGIYKALYGDNYYKHHMYTLHAQNLTRLRDILKNKYPTVNIQMFLHMLNGKILQLVE